MIKLNKLYYLKQEIIELQDEIKSLSELTSIELTGMPHGGKISNPTEQYFIKKQKLIDKLNNKLEKYTDELTTIESFIDSIDDPDVRVIARLRFIDNLKWEQIGKIVHFDRTVCYKKLKKYMKERE